MLKEIKDYFDDEMTDLAAMTPEERARIAAEDFLHEKMLWRICQLFWKSRTNHLGRRWLAKTTEEWLKLFPELTNAVELAEHLCKLEKYDLVIERCFRGTRQIGVRPTEECKEMVKTWSGEPTGPWSWGEPS
jgi:hypothetical protein